MAPHAWMDRALCAQLPLDQRLAFTSDDPEEREWARTQVCAYCPVRVECYQAGIALSDRHTVRAGTRLPDNARRTKGGSRRSYVHQCDCGVPTNRASGICPGCEPDGRAALQLAQGKR